MDEGWWESVNCLARCCIDSAVVPVIAQTKAGENGNVVNTVRVEGQAAANAQVTAAGAWQPHHPPPPQCHPAPVPPFVHGADGFMQLGPGEPSAGVSWPSIPAAGAVPLLPFQANTHQHTLQQPRAQPHQQQPRPLQHFQHNSGQVWRPQASGQAAGPRPTVAAKAQSSDDDSNYKGPCPYDRCPGVFQLCGAVLQFRYPHQPGDSGYWGCARYPACEYRYYPHPRKREPSLSLEIVGERFFKVVPMPGAEEAVRCCVGVHNLLREHGVDLTAAVQAPVAMDIQAVARPGGYAEEDALYFPLERYEEFLASCRPHARALLQSGSEIPPHALASYRNTYMPRAGPEEVQYRLARMPPSLRAALMPFQLEGVRFGIERNGRCLIADEMGVGKTLQAIALASCYEEEWPMLVIVPASLRLLWAEEIEKWLPHVRPSSVHVIEGKDQRLTGRMAAGKALPSITITSYEMMRRLCCPACCKMRDTSQEAAAGSGDADVRGQDQDQSRGRGQGQGPQNPPKGGRGSTKAECWGPDRCMAAMPWGVVVVDESHNLRTTTARENDSPHTEACVVAVKRARRAVLLTGTPSLAKPFDLFRQVDALRPGLVGGSKQLYAFRYCDGRLVPSRAVRMAWGKPARAQYDQDTRQIHYRADYSGGSRLSELHGLLAREVMIRRLKRDVMGQLPPKRRQVVRLPHPRSWPGGGNALRAAPDEPHVKAPPAKKQRAGSGIGGEGVKARGSVGMGAAQPADGAVGDASAVAGGPEDDDDDEEEEEEGDVDDDDSQQASAAASDGGDGVKRMSGAHRTALAKLPDAIAWLVSQLGGGGGEGEEARPYAAATGSGDQPKFLVFAHHRDVMDRLAEALQGFDGVDASLSRHQQPEGAQGSDTSSGWGGVSYVRIDGSNDSTERRQAVIRFRDDPAVRVALLSITAAAVGLDFSTANAVVFVELPNEVALLRQAEDRAHRKGQVNSVNVYFLCAKGTCDDRRWQKLNESLCSITQLHDGPAGFDQQQQGRGGGTPDAVAGVGRGVMRGLDVDVVVDMEDAEAGRQVPKTLPLDSCLAQQSPPQSPPHKSLQGPGASQQAASQSPSAAETARGYCCDLDAPSPSYIPGTPSPEPGCSSQQGPEEDSSLAPGDTELDVLKGPELQCQLTTAGQGPPQQPGPGLGLGPGPPQAHSQGATESAPLLPNSPLQADGYQQLAERAALVPTSLLPASLAAPGTLALTATQAGAALPNIYFEVSPHTGRVHMHLRDDGSAALGMSLPLELLLLQESTTLQTLLSTHAAEWAKAYGQERDLALAAGDIGAAIVSGPERKGPGASEAQEQLPGPFLSDQGHGVAAAAAASASAAPEMSDARSSPGFVGPLGVVAVLCCMDPAQLLEVVEEARSFARDWQALRAVHRKRLYGNVLERYFQDTLEQVMAAAAAAGAFGSSTVRYIQDAPLRVPPGAALRAVRVKASAYYRPADPAKPWREYQQAFAQEGQGQRLCLHCCKPVADCSMKADALLPNTDYLFCEPACETRYYTKASGSTLRRLLARLERGVCQMCSLDCSNLVRQLQAIRTNSRDYLTKRRQVVERLAPRFCERGYAAHLDRLLKQATEGMAWQADHIRPVFLGGGLCDMDNMRTLCTACHADVTREQAKERAATRRQRALKTKDIRTFLLPSQAPPGSQGQGDQRQGPAAAGGKGAGAAGAVKRKRPADVQVVVIDDDSDEDLAVRPVKRGGSTRMGAAATAAVPAGGSKTLSKYKLEPAVGAPNCTPEGAANNASKRGGRGRATGAAATAPDLSNAKTGAASAAAAAAAAAATAATAAGVCTAGTKAFDTVDLLSPAASGGDEQQRPRISEQQQQRRQQEGQQLPGNALGQSFSCSQSMMGTGGSPRAVSESPRLSLAQRLRLKIAGAGDAGLSQAPLSQQQQPVSCSPAAAPAPTSEQQDLAVPASAPSMLKAGKLEGCCEPAHPSSRTVTHVPIKPHQGQAEEQETADEAPSLRHGNVQRDPSPDLDDEGLARRRAFDAFRLGASCHERHAAPHNLPLGRPLAAALPAAAAAKPKPKAKAKLAGPLPAANRGRAPTKRAAKAEVITIDDDDY